VGIIAEERVPFHPVPSRRVLYAGADLALLASLKTLLKDCQVVRSPGAVARSLVASKLDYSLLLFDEEFSELAHFARALPHRQGTPVIILPADKADYADVLTAVVCLLARPGRAGYNFSWAPGLMSEPHGEAFSL
jgi:hypothetical protein